ncbi:MAG: N-acetylmuramoyl-L-alanine amidase [Elusimicrobiota bacterium]|jgi:N-acetylmuramoyl-L-alanine amidase|nr:N-acetylmuramoyl-L-alanine amidase [Elusimicrobiota bacterium]
MKKTIRFLLIFFIFLSFFSYPLNSAQNNGTRRSTVIIDGVKSSDLVSVINSGSSVLSLRDLAILYGAFLEWKPISAIASLYINNRKIDIKIDDNSIYLDKKRKKVSEPSRLIGNDVFISADIFNFDEFSDIVQSDAKWDARNLVLTIDRRLNIAPARYFTRPESTQIVIHLTEPLPYSISKTTNAVVLNIMKGKIKNERVNVANGVVKDIIYEDGGRLASVKINLSQTPKRIKTAKLSKPDRISILVEHKEPIDITTAYSSENSNRIASEYDDVSAFLIPTESLGSAKIMNTKNNDSGGADDLIGLFSKTDAPSSNVKNNYEIVQNEWSGSMNKTVKKANERKIIVIDPGHGGQDPGAIGAGGTNEKDVVLAIAYELKKLLDEDGGYRTILTRSDDRFIPLGTRAEIANKLHADLFISIHCNANINRSVDGFEIYFLSEKATDPQALATENLENSVIELESKSEKEKTNLQKMFWSMTLNEYMNEAAELSSFIAAETPKRLKIQNRGVKQAGFYVLRGAEMPAVLVESAFISNYSQEAKLRTSAFQILVADAVYEGIVRYFARKDRYAKK